MEWEAVEYLKVSRWDQKSQITTVETLIGPGERFVSKKLSGDSAFEIVWTLVSAKSGSFPLSKAPGQECYEAFLTPMPLHTLGQMCSHRRLFPQWACRHGDLGKIHAQQHPTQAPTRRTAVPIPKARGHCHRRGRHL